MRKPRPYPFERNRYFYGKLLTVRDFELEQHYAIEKSRLLNRLLLGSGIVSGLTVTRLDDQFVAIDPGLAIDQTGREIIIPVIEKKKLSAIEGFPISDFDQNVYLCAVYDEKMIEPVHAVANAANRSEEVREYNRTHESYKLVIRDRPPSLEELPYRALLERITVLYDGPEVRVWLQAPAYVENGAVFEVAVHVEKALRTEAVSLELDTESEAFRKLESVGGSHLSFTEPATGGRTAYTETFAYRVRGTEESLGELRVVPDSFRLRVGDKQIAVKGEDIQSLTLQITEGPVSERILHDYFATPLDRAFDPPLDDCIYLAKISLTQITEQMRHTYSIEMVENAPFQDFIYNPTLLHRLGGGSAAVSKKEAVGEHMLQASLEVVRENERPDLSVSYDPSSNTHHLLLQLPQAPKLPGDYRTGFIDLPVKPTGIRPFARHDIISDEISHGLGTGQVLVQIGVESEGGGVFSDFSQSGESVYYGSLDVFKDTEFESDVPKLTIGTIVYPRKGTFRVGVKLQQAVETETIRLRWWAFRRNAEVRAMPVYTEEAAAASSEDEDV